MLILTSIPKTTVSVYSDYYEKSLASFLERRKQDPHSPAYENFGFIHPE